MAESIVLPAASVSIMTVPVATEEAHVLVAAGRDGRLRPFLRPEWIFAYLETFEPRATLEIIAVHRHGEPIGILPLIRERELVLRRAGSPFARPVSAICP